MNIPFYVFAWIACGGYALETVLGKANSKYGMSNPWMFNFFWNLFIAIPICIIAVYHGVGLPTHWGNIIVVAAIYAACGALFILALYKVDVSVLAPMFSIRNALAVLFATLIVHESLSLEQYLLIGVIFIFGIFASTDEKWTIKSFLSSGIAIALLLMVALALEGVFLKIAIAQTNYWDTTLWQSLLGQGFLLLTLPLFYKSLKTLTLRQLGGSFFTALGGVIGTLAANYAYSVNVSISSSIISIPLSMILTVIFSYFKPGILEKHTLKVYAIRFASAAIMITAALRLG